MQDSQDMQFNFLIPINILFFNLIIRFFDFYSGTEFFLCDSTRFSMYLKIHFFVCAFKEQNTNIILQAVQDDTDLDFLLGRKFDCDGIGNLFQMCLKSISPFQCSFNTVYILSPRLSSSEISLQLSECQS